ncbi:MAG: helix-turn-helix transcriptional regulator [Candidatus Saccharibacteria bacterium]|nr:helix-turn-helix transcriptional regulator [Rhodoferax sp.]
MPKKPLTPQKALGLRLKELRAEKSITQEELAERTGLFRTYMSRIEAGLANPTLTVLHTLATGLEIPITDLFILAQTQPRRVNSAQPISRGRVR